MTGNIEHLVVEYHKLNMFIVCVLPLLYSFEQESYVTIE